MEEAWEGVAGLAGERRALVAGMVLGEDEGLDAGLRDRFRASGLYHLLTKSRFSRSPGSRLENG